MKPVTKHIISDIFATIFTMPSEPALLRARFRAAGFMHTFISILISVSIVSIVFHSDWIHPAR
jgi:hypothetical protein